MDISGVLCLRAPNSNAGPFLQLYDPRPRNIDWHANDETPDAATVVRLQPGDMVMFPPWLNHSVKPPRDKKRKRRDYEASDDARITLPFNVILVDKHNFDKDANATC